MSSNFKNLYTSNNPPLQATLMRGSNIESIHKIHAVITDKKGRVLMCAGNPEYKSFIRSALKPFQASASVKAGAVKHFNFSSKEIALMCASHNGEDVHVNTANEMLKKVGYDLSYYECGAHSPYDKNSKRRYYIIMRSQIHYIIIAAGSMLVCYL